MADKLIEMSNVFKEFDLSSGKLPVLKSLQLTVSEGELISIVGKSGSGKSTLLSIMGLLDDISSGDFKLCGHDVRSLSNYQKSIIRNENIGWIFQNFNLVEEMTVAENVSLPLRYNNKISSKHYSEIVNQALSDVDLGDKYGQYPSQLSGGQQQRAAIARALVNSPDLILADEPTGNLDEENSQKIFELLKKLNGHKKTTIVIVTHDNQLAEQCNRGLTLKDGVFVNNH
ncbi:ABC transporter ATP-binding protein [Alteromonadaceae bacterium M269]|nr:ABC transporter ATP-binding protein [Alteromonadaceae bacterium M269]